MATRLDGPTLFAEHAQPFVATFHLEAKEICVRRDLGPCERRRGLGEPDPARSAANSLQRASSRVRVLAKANGLCRLATLTFRDGRQERQEVLSAVSAFGRRLSERLPKLRYIYVLERHPGGHGYHVHLGFSRFVPKDLLAEIWGLGFVDVRMIKSKRTGYRQNGADVARYLVKYLLKTAAETPKGKRRFSGSHNLVDTVLEASFETLAEAIVWVHTVIRPTWEFFIDDRTVEGWRGPPCWLFRE